MATLIDIRRKCEAWPCGEQAVVAMRDRVGQLRGEFCQIHGDERLAAELERERDVYDPATFAAGLEDAPSGLPASALPSLLGDEDEVNCARCGSWTDWECCPDCGGDGWVTEDDGVNGPEDYVCGVCGGEGGWLFCPGCRIKAGGLLP